MLTDSFRWNIFDKPFFSRIKKAENGVNITIRKEIIPEAIIAIGSAKSFAMLFGITSPKMSTMTVVAIVETREPYFSPTRFIASIVAIEEHAILTILLPMSIVVSALSYFARTFRVRCAAWLPLSAIFLRRILFALFSAVSVAEKNAEHTISITIRKICIDYSQFFQISGQYPVVACRPFRTIGVL